MINIGFLVFFYFFKISSDVSKRQLTINRQATARPRLLERTPLAKDNPKIIYATKTLETLIYWGLKNKGSCFSWAPLYSQPQLQHHLWSPGLILHGLHKSYGVLHADIAPPSVGPIVAV